MAVSSRTNIPKKMTESYQYFDIGDVFRYTPTSDPEREIIFEVICPAYAVPCTGNCDMVDFCLKSPFVPLCNKNYREDKNFVIFKAIG